MATGNPISSWLLYPFHMPPSFVEYFLIFWQHKLFQRAHPVVSLFKTWTSPLLPKNLWYLFLKNGIYKRRSGWCSLLLKWVTDFVALPAKRARKHIYVCVCVCTHVRAHTHNTPSFFSTATWHSITKCSPQFI